jgi:hypothetical protein
VAGSLAQLHSGDLGLRGSEGSIAYILNVPPKDKLILGFAEIWSLSYETRTKREMKS